MKCDAPKEGCNESLHPAICVKLPVAGLRRQMRKRLPMQKQLAICMDDDSSAERAVASSSGSRRDAIPLGERTCPTNGRATTACFSRWKCALRVQKRKAPGSPEALQRTKQDRYRFCKRRCV